MKKLKLAILTIIVAVSTFPVSFVAYTKCYVEPFVQSFPEWMRPFVEYEPYPKTLYALVPVALSTVLATFWLGYLVKTSRKPLTTKKSVTNATEPHPSML